MNYPAFFDQVRTIKMQDPLAEFLGASEDGIIDYTYLDLVKLAGHSCPTVAGAYLMTMKALAALYPDAIPQRGGIKLSFRSPIDLGVTGVIANVAGMITGAAQSGGFKGIAGRFDRRDLLKFEMQVAGEIGFSRVDTGAEVIASFHAQTVPMPPAVSDLLPKMISGSASPSEQKEFGRAWQERVKRILIDRIDDPELVVLTKEGSSSSACNMSPNR